MIVFNQVHDGYSTDAPQLAKLCGNQIPPPIRSSKERMYVKLRTDDIVHTGGFLANYQTSMWHKHINIYPNLKVLMAMS